MVSRLDLQKRRQWEARYKRFRASGLTVGQFCKREGVSASMFYYWAKRVRLPVPAVTQLPVVTASTPGSTPRKAGDSLPDSFSGRRRGWVRFRWNATMEVLVPADCLDAIRCLAECLKRASVERSAERSDAFQEVVVRS